MEIPEHLHALFSASVKDYDGEHVVEVPSREFTLGELQEDETYRVAILPATGGTTATESETDDSDIDAPPEPPVEEGEQRQVEIEDIGEQGDGITRVERGYVVIVPDTQTGERVRIEISDVRQNVAFADVVERLDYYE
jgi:predicted RNA-binding protein with TRAM domain